MNDNYVVCKYENLKCFFLSKKGNLYVWSELFSQRIEFKERAAKKYAALYNGFVEPLTLENITEFAKQYATKVGVSNVSFAYVLEYFLIEKTDNGEWRTRQIYSV